MLLLSPRSLKAKIMTCIGGGLALMLLPCIGYLAMQARSEAFAEAHGVMAGEADHASEIITSGLAQAAAATQSAAALFGRAHEQGAIDRQELVEALKAELEIQPAILATWFLEMPGAFDSHLVGAETNNALGADENGIFSPYWMRDAAGELSLTTLIVNYEDDWNRLAAETRKGALTEPYEYDGMLMTSVAYPVLSGETLIGVAGVDIDLGALSGALATLAPMGSGQAMLLSGSGSWIAHLDAGLRAQPYGAGEGSAELATALESGQMQLAHLSSDDAEGTLLRMFVPFAIPGLNATWVAVVDVPEAVIVGPANRQTLTMVLVGLAIILAALAIVLAAAHWMVSRPLSQAVSLARTIEAGDLTQRIETRSRDEIGNLLRAMGAMSAKLSDIVGEVNGGAVRVSSGSDEMAATAEQLSQGATEQAAATEEASASVEQMTANIRQTAHSASETETMAKTAAADARTSGQAVGEAMGAMKTIAERSQTAAGEINALSATTVRAAERAGQQLEQLVPTIERTAGLVSQISHANQELATGAQQVSLAIQQLDQVTQENTAAAEQTSSTAEQLSAQAGALRTAMEFFRVRAGGAGDSPAPVMGAPARTGSPVSSPRSAPAPRSAGSSPKSKAKGGFSLDLTAGEDDLDAQFRRAG